MLNLESLKKIHGSLKSDVTDAESKLTALEAEIQRIRADGTRHPDWTRDKIAEARAVALPAIGAIVRTFDERVAALVAQEKFWSSKLLLLSQQRFSQDDGADALRKMQTQAEFAGLSAGLLQLAADDAAGDNDLPRLWRAMCAGQLLSGQEGWHGVDLNAITVPGQGDALAMIAAGKDLAWSAHNIYAVASGAVLTSTNKLARARAQQKLMNAPTPKYTSSDRTPFAA